MSITFFLTHIYERRVYLFYWRSRFARIEKDTFRCVIRTNAYTNAMALMQVHSSPSQFKMKTKNVVRFSTAAHFVHSEARVSSAATAIQCAFETTNCISINIHKVHGIHGAQQQTNSLAKCTKNAAMNSQWKTKTSRSKLWRRKKRRIRNLNQERPYEMRRWDFMAIFMLFYVV